MSLKGRWDEMQELITVDVIHELSTIGTREEVARVHRERWGDFNYATTMEVRTPGDTAAEKRVKNLMAIHRGQA